MPSKATASSEFLPKAVQPLRLGPAAWEAIIVISLAIAVYLLSSKYDLLEKFVEFSREHEERELDEFLMVGLFFLLYLIFLALRKQHALKKANLSLLQSNQELRQAIDEVHELRRIIPICARCKKVREDDGYWHMVDDYLRRHTSLKFTHGICPECFAILYPDLKLPDAGLEPPADSSQAENV